MISASALFFLTAGALAGILTAYFVSGKTGKIPNGRDLILRLSVSGILLGAIFCAGSYCFSGALQARFSGLSVLLLAVSLYDIDIRKIPNRLILAALVLFGLTCVFIKDLLPALAGAAILGGGTLLISIAADRIFRRRSIGGGDLKLLFIAGLYLHTGKGILCLTAACLLAMTGLLLRRKKEIAFGPYISASILLCAFLGDAVLEWYTAL